jgi:long-chain acyl-CoA synthetase
MARGAMNLVAMLESSVHDFGPRPLFGTRSQESWTWISYSEFARQVDALRGGLASLGIERGDRVAVVSRNGVKWAVGCYAVAGLGAAYVPMYEAQAVRDWRHILTDSGAKVCLVSGGEVRDRVASVAREVAGLKTLIDFDAPADASGGYAHLLAHGAQHPADPVALRDDDLAELVYTSGTTGNPKGVRLTHSNVVSNVDALTKILPFSHEDRSLSILPWAHVFGGAELHGIIAFGASTALCESVDQLAEAMSEVKPTLFFAVPRVWNRFYQRISKVLAEQPPIVQGVVRRARAALHRKRAGEVLGLLDAVAVKVADKLVFSRVRGRLGGRLVYAVSGAAALSPEVAEFMDDVGVVLLEAYGLTESSACATVNLPDDRRIGTVGKPIPGVRVKIEPVPGVEGGTGEIIIYGHGVMAGYHNLPERTAETLTSDGGLRTGDLGHIDDDGFLHVTGRIKEIYKLENGKYVAPAPIEEQLTLSPLIEQAFVHGANMPYNVALIVPSREALQAWARERGKQGVARAALLRESDLRVLFAAEIERASSGLRGYERIDRFELIDEPFTTDNGQLTPTLKMKRSEVTRCHRDALDAMYVQAAGEQVPHVA